MISWIVTCDLGTDYYDTLRVPCDDVYDAIYRACAQFGCTADCVVSVTRVVV